MRTLSLIILFLFLLLPSKSIFAQTTPSCALLIGAEIQRVSNNIPIPLTCGGDETRDACFVRYYQDVIVSKNSSCSEVPNNNSTFEFGLYEELRTKFIENRSIGATPTPPPISDFSQLEGALSSYTHSIDQTVAGSIGGPCLAGNIELGIDPIDDFSTDIKGESQSGLIKNILENAKKNLVKLTQSGMHYWNTIRGSVVSTDFCPVDKDQAIPVFSTDTGGIVFSNDHIKAASGKSDEELDALVTTEGGFTSGHRRAIAAFRLLKSTTELDVYQRARAFESIEERLSSEPPISCECKDRVQYAEDLQRQRGSLNSIDSILANKSKNNKEPSVLGITVRGKDYPFSEIDDIWGINLRGNQELRENYCEDLSTDERVKKYNSDDPDICYQKLGDTYLSAKQSCGSLLSLDDHEEEHMKCLQCSWLDSGAWTAIGCIHSDFSKTVERLFTIALGFGGLSALGCIIYATFLMQTSAGNPEKTKKAQELITSCIAGLILIIFSVFILRVLGVDILRIPGFN